MGEFYWWRRAGGTQAQKGGEKEGLWVFVQPVQGLWGFWLFDVGVVNVFVCKDTSDKYQYGEKRCFC